MNKICKYHIAFNIIIFVLLLLVLRKLNVIEETITENIKKTEAIEVLENYNPHDVELIIIGNFVERNRYYFLTEKEDSEYFAKFIEMFWGESADYVEKDTFYLTNHGWQITFVNSLGEMLTLYVYGEEEVGYGGVGDRGVRFTHEGIDYDVVKQMMQEVALQNS